MLTVVDSEKSLPPGKVLLRATGPQGSGTARAPLCSGLARRPLKAVARVRIPSGLPIERHPLARVPFRLAAPSKTHGRSHRLASGARMAAPSGRLCAEGFAQIGQWRTHGCAIGQALRGGGS